MIKGALFDIDDTLFSHKIKAVPTLTLKALDELKQKGIKIGVCTSRIGAEMHTIPKELTDRIDCYVLSTGAITMKKDSYYKAYTLKYEDLKEYIDYFKANNIPFDYSDVNGDLFFDGDEKLLKDRNLLSWAKNVMIKEYEGEEVTSLFFWAYTQEQADYIKNINENKYISWWGTCGNIGPELVDKSFGLLKFCQMFSLTTDEVIAFGDGGNDDTMLEMAGIGVAIKDGNEHTKQVADYVCKKSIEDGGIYETLIDLKVLEQKQYNPKIFFFDNDDTLYSHKVDKVLDSTYLALEKLKAKGYKLCMNTSRSYEEMYNVPKKLLDLMDDLNLISGAYCVHGDKVDVKYIDDDVVKKAIKLFDEHNLTYRYCTGDGKGYLNRIDDYANLFKKLYDMIPAQKKFEGERVTHLLYYADRNLCEEIANELGDISISYLTVGAEIGPKNCDKGTTLIETIKKYNYSIEDSCAFGDSGNDITMLKNAGLGIALGNGCPAVKQAADYITDDADKDGIYNALVHFNIID